VDTFDDSVCDLIVGHVAPPKQHVGLLEPIDAEAMLGLVKRGGGDIG
jgi:hypothetical protein